MNEKEILEILKDISEQEHDVPDGFSKRVMQRVHEQEVKKRSSIMKKFLGFFKELFSKRMVFATGVVSFATLVLVFNNVNTLQDESMRHANFRPSERPAAVTAVKPSVDSEIMPAEIKPAEKRVTKPSNGTYAGRVAKKDSKVKAPQRLAEVTFNDSRFDSNSQVSDRDISSSLSKREIIRNSSQRRKARANVAQSSFSEGNFAASNEYSQIYPGYHRAPLPAHDVVRPSANTEQYNQINENTFLEAKNNPLSTFSIDVDTASYANVRRFLNQSALPPKDSVRIEEMINYFKYDYPSADSMEEPFSVNTELGIAPWNSNHSLLKIGLKGVELDEKDLAPSNLVFLIDVSGSMSSQNKLGLLKKSFKLLVEKLGEKDKVSIAVYAGAAGEVLAPTEGSNKEQIIAAIERLNAGGSTAGGAGIELAYNLAKRGFIKGGNNRVILATDGDFNVGISNQQALTKMIEKKRDSGVFLSVLGFGMGNYKDSRMEQLANKGNGNYSYIDSIREAKKVLVHDLRGTLFTIVKDVKIQIEFNPANVHSYRLIGYENRMLKKEDFNNDKKDAGELGAGHTVTAMYEIVSPEAASKITSVDALKYSKVEKPKEKTAKVAAAKQGTGVPEPGQREEAFSNELATVKLRYKLPSEKVSRLTSVSVEANPKQLAETSKDFRFASAVAQFGMIGEVKFGILLGK